MPKRNLAWVVVIVLIAAGLWKLPKTAATLDSLDKTFGPMMAVRAKIAEHYVDTVEDDELVAGAIRGMLSELDPYSNYISPEDIAEFNKMAGGEYGGIGIEIGKIRDGRLIVVTPIEDSPAFHEGILAEDRILAVDGVSLKKNISIPMAVRLISGKAGTMVTLTVHHPTHPEPRDITIRRGTISIASVKGWYRRDGSEWVYFVDRESRIAYVRLIQFVNASRGELSRQIHRLREERMNGLILDLRDNGGGLLTSAVAIADLFLPSGTIVTTRRMGKQIDEWIATREGTLAPFPLVVLINRGSASASEIVAGALRDHGRATIVGERSYGKGSVQNVYSLPGDNTRLKLTVAYYHLPNGQCIHRTKDSEQDQSWGVAPDVEEVLTDQEIMAMGMARRSSDVIHPPSTRPADGEDAATTTRPAATTQAGPPPVDRQLARAIEILREQIDPSATETTPSPEAP